MEPRRLQGAPPLCTLFVVTVSGAEEEQVRWGSTRVRAAFDQALGQEPEVRVLGPAPAAILKVNNRYRYRVTLAAPDTKAIRRLVDGVIRGMAAERQCRKLSIWADMDPQD